MNHRRSFVLVLMGLMFFLFSCFLHVPATTAKPIVLKAGSVWEESLLWNDGLRIFSDMVAKESKGELTVKFVGGAETFPMFESIEILRKGVIDILASEGAYIQALPAVFTQYISELSAEEERKSGYHDALNKLHQKFMNAVSLGRMSDSQFLFVFKKPVNKADFSGIKIRGLPFCINLIKELKGSPIIVAPAELYSALEKGVAEGYAYPQVGHVERKLPELAKYYIDHPFYQTSSRLLCNLGTWNKLPPHLQKLVTDLMPRVERETLAKHQAIVKSEREELIKLGVKFVKWEAAEEKALYAAARKSGIEEAKRLSPDQAPELIKLIMK